jgi:hypothetical protein
MSAWCPIGFHAALRQLTRAAATLLVIDETHTLSSGPGGYTRVHGLEPDFFVCGKAVAGGVPCAVYGFTAAVEGALRRVWSERGHGHSGLGTTLTANLLALAALEATLAELMTPAAYAHMERLATQLERGLGALFSARATGWNVTRVGARLEIAGGARPAPRWSRKRDAPDARATAAPVPAESRRAADAVPQHAAAVPATIAAVERLLAALDAALAGSPECGHARRHAGLPRPSPPTSARCRSSSPTCAASRAANMARGRRRSTAAAQPRVPSSATTSPARTRMRPASSGGPAMPTWYAGRWRAR